MQKARSYIYTTAMPPVLAVAARESLLLIRNESWRRDKLQELIRQFRSGCEHLPIPLLPSDTPIQILVAGSVADSLRIQDDLRSNGLLVSAIRPPTVPINSSRLRITLSAAHEIADVNRLLDALARFFRK